MDEIVRPRIIQVQQNNVTAITVGEFLKIKAILTVEKMFLIFKYSLFD